MAIHVSIFVLVLKIQFNIIKARNLGIFFKTITNMPHLKKSRKKIALKKLITQINYYIG